MTGNTTANKQRPLTELIWPVISNIGSKARGALVLILRTNSGRIALPIVLIHFLLVIAGTWMAPYSYTEFQYNESGGLEQLLPPSTQFWLGTDQFGRDVLSRVMSGATSLLIVSSLGAVIGITLGTAIGMTSAYKGGYVDNLIMRVLDGLMSFPSLLLALLVITTLGPSHTNIVGTVAIVTIPRVARVLRSITLSLKELDFVQSARLRGESTPYIVFRELLPNTLPVLGVELSVRLSYSILIVSSLGFLGMGVQPPSPDWGLMISQNSKFLAFAPWIALAPAGAVASLVIGVNLLTDGIRQASGLPREDKSA
jgi:peptide/nickel transport system permease protein